MRLKVAVVGAGSMSMKHLRVLRDFSEGQVQLVGIADTAEPALQRAMHRFHVANYADYQQMVEQTQPDLVVDGQKALRREVIEAVGLHYLANPMCKYSCEREGSCGYGAWKPMKQESQHSSVASSRGRR